MNGASVKKTGTTAYFLISTSENKYRMEVRRGLDYLLDAIL